MKILDLNSSFVRAILAKKLEKIIQQKFDVEPSLIMSELSASENGDTVVINTTAQIVMSKKDLTNIILK